MSEIDSVDEILKVSITGDRTNLDLRQYENFVYDKATSEYSGIVFGYFDDGFECSGGASGSIEFPYDGLKMKRIKESSELPDVRGLGLDNLYDQEDFDWREWYDEDDILDDDLTKPYEFKLTNTKKGNFLLLKLEISEIFLLIAG